MDQEQTTQETPQQELSVHERALQAFDEAAEVSEPKSPIEGIDAEETQETQETEENAEQVEEPKVDEKKELISQYHRNLARLEYEKTQLQRELKAAKEQSAPQVDPEIQKLLELKEEAKFDPISWLEAAGITSEDVHAYELNGGKPRESKDVVNLKKTIEQMQKEREEEKQKAAEREKEQARLSKISEIKAEILERKEDYPLISMMNTYVDPNSGQVVNLYETVDEVVEEAAKEGQKLSRYDAAKKVESFVTRNIQQEFEALANVPSVRKMAEAILAKYQTKPDNGVEDQLRPDSAQQVSQAEETKTLTNSLNQTAGKQPSKELTDEERRERAIQVLGNF